jgi:hypothetical protein
LPTSSRWAARVPWLAIIVTVLVLLSAALAVPPVRDAVSLTPIPFAHLSYSAGYLAVAPLWNVLDTLTLFTVRQHIALLVWVFVLYATWRVRRGRPRESTRRRAVAECAFAALLLFIIVCVYALAALPPRPMAALAISDPMHNEVLAVDFHAHTHFSHDGRSGWTAADVGAWHADAGFDAAYITDHASVAGAEQGIADDPPQAGEGITLLQGIEAYYGGEHVNVLGAQRRYKGLLSPNLKDVDTQTLALASALPGLEPVLIQTLPGNLAKMLPAHGPGTPGVRAIEIVDGAPRGLQQTRLERLRVIHLADSLDLALVSGSDNHGWGRAAPAWTLLDIRGWRGMSPDSLESEIERSLRLGRRRATHVVERVVADPGADRVALIFAPPIATWRMLTTLSSDERVMWILWIWAITIAMRAIAVRRDRSAA